MGWLAPLISAGSSLIGGLLGRKSSSDAAEEQADLQKEFARNAIQWKVADAKKAGVHPLYALGAQTTSYQPVSVGDPLPGALHDMGQDISRAVAATSPESRRVGVLGELAVERAGLENELLRTQIGRLQAPHVPPGVGDPTLNGSRELGSINTVPMPRTSSFSNDPGHVPDVGWARTKTGFVPIPSLDVKQRIEDNLPHEVAHFFRNNVLPSIVPSRINPPFAARPGERWVYEAGEYRLKPWTPPRTYRGTLDFN